MQKAGMPGRYRLFCLFPPALLFSPLPCPLLIRSSSSSSFLLFDDMARLCLCQARLAMPCYAAVAICHVFAIGALLLAARLPRAVCLPLRLLR